MLHMHPRVELPDGSYTLIPEVGAEGADGDVHNVEVNQDLDQSPEEPKANHADEGKHRIITTFSKFLCNYLCYACAFTFQELL